MRVVYAYTAKGKKSSTFLDITRYITTISWGGSDGEVARKISFNLVNPQIDPNIKPITLKLGSMIYLYDDNNKELFRGYVTDREKGSKSELSYTAYDMLFYLLKSTATYNFKGKKPEDIVTKIGKDFKLPVGSVAKAGKKYNVLMKDKSLYNVIMAGYTKDKKATGRKYRVYTEKGKLCVRKLGDEWCTILFRDDTNIISSSFKESITNVVNKVVIYDDKHKVVKVVKNSASMEKYGIFQRTITKEKGKDATKQAKALLNGVTRSIDIECIGYAECVTGKCVKVVDSATGLEGKFYVDSDTHTWQNGVHTMRITLKLHQNMDTVEADKEDKK